MCQVSLFVCACCCEHAGSPRRVALCLLLHNQHLVQDRTGSHASSSCGHLERCTVRYKNLLAEALGAVCTTRTDAVAVWLGSQSWRLLFLSRRTFH